MGLGVGVAPWRRRLRPDRGTMPLRPPPAKKADAEPPPPAAPAAAAVEKAEAEGASPAAPAVAEVEKEPATASLPAATAAPPVQTACGSGSEVLLQAFNWESCREGGGWWRRLAREAEGLAEAGFTAVWLPPRLE